MIAIESLGPSLALLALTLIQSLLGVGVLLFGTPIFILLGYSFYEVLVLLLPISAVISAGTYISVRCTIFGVYNYLILSVFSLMGTVLAVRYFQDFANMLIAILLSVSLLLSSVNKETINTFVKRHRSLSFSCLAFLHSISNQGGILLVWLVKLHNVDKSSTRSSIASAYGVLAATQLITLVLLDAKKFFATISITNIIVPLLGFYLGNLMFNRMRQGVYDNLINLTILIFIGLLAYKSIIR